MLLQTLLYAALLVAGSAQDGPRVTARLSSTSVSLGEPVIFEIAVEGADGSVEITAPRIPAGLVLTGTQDFTEMHLSIPGGRTQTRRREFALHATSPGRFRIPAVTVFVAGRNYRTSPVELVVSGVPQPRTVESSNEVWLRATMSPETVYVGQQSTLTVEAGFAEDIRLRLTRPPVFDTPSPTGFWVQDVPGGIQARLRSVNGQITEVHALQRAYFPLSSGRFAFAPARAVIDVREGFLFAPETREVRSASPKLTVLPLPEEGRPRDFKGAVGSFTVHASIQPDTVSVGEAAQVTVEVTGVGNIKTAPQPALPVIAGVEQFTPTEESTVAFDGAIARGSKTFQWVIIPDQPGRVEIPAVSYVFFDPVARAYRTATTAANTLFVVPSTGDSADNGSTSAALHALRTEPRHSTLGWVKTRTFLLVQLIPVGVLLLLLAVRLRRGRSPASVLLLELRRVRSANAPFHAFLRDLEAVVRGAAAERTNDVRLRTAEVRVVGDSLRSVGVSGELAARVVALIERIETQRFASSAGEAAERQSLVTEAEYVVTALLAPQKKKGQARAAVATAALVAASLQATGGSAFDRGVELYRAGHFAESAVEFEKAVQDDSTNVSAWANLGNANYRAGHRGRAIWAWARAARETPRDGALARNLQSVGAVEVLRTRPPLSVRPVEWYFLAALAWWLAAAIAGVAVLRRRNSLFGWALPFIALVVIGMVVGVIADGRGFAVALDEETRLYGDPTIHSPVVRRVQAGAGLDVLDSRGEWLRVRTVTQAEGWVERDAVGMLQ